MRSFFVVFNPLRWAKSFLITLVALFLVIWFGFLDSYSFYTRFALARQRSELKSKTELLRVEIAELDKKIDELSQNPALLERIARERYGMRRNGETVYRVVRK